MNNYNNIYKNLSDNGVTINAIKSLGDAMNKSDFLKAGLKAIPYVGDAVKFISALFGGGASSSGPVILAPLTVDLSIGLTGTITTQDPMHNQTIGLPGSQQASILAGTYGNSPLYNETLGIFSLIDIPKMYYTESVASKSYTNYTRDGALGEQAHKDIRNYDLKYRNYKLDGNSFRYAINPASKLIIQDAQIMLIANYEKPSLLYSKKEGYSIYNLDTDSNNGLPIQFSNSLSIPIEYRKTNIGNLIDEDKSIFQNSFP